MDVNLKYPRTLIIGAHFSEESGTGLYLGRLFSSWPAEDLATMDSSGLSPDWRRCRRHYRTGAAEFPARRPFGWMGPTSPSGPWLPTKGTAPKPPVPRNSSSLGRRLTARVRGLLRVEGVRETIYRVAAGPSPELLAWVQQFRPEVIYGCCSDLNSVRFLQRMALSLELPLVLQFMDDWPENLYRKGWALHVWRRRYLKELTALIQSAAVRIAICKEMAEEYECRFGCPVLWLPMPVELAEYQCNARVEWSAGKPFRLRYGGRVGWAIRESLADLARAVAALRKDGAEIVFDLVTLQEDEVPAVCFASAGVAVKALGPLVELPRLQSEADLLVVCYDFDPESYRLARLSMPSKLADCLASGSPILVYGPAGLPVVEYARREGWAKIVDRREPEELRSALQELMTSTTLREQLGRRAKTLASEYHNAKTVSERFRTILENAARGETKL